MAQAAFKLLYPVVLDGTETIKWEDTDGVHTETLTAGTYYCHNDTAFTDYPSLYEHIEDVMNAAAASGFVFSISGATPTSSSGQSRAGIKISTSNPALSWTYYANGTINLGGYLGFGFAGTTYASTSGVVTAPYTYGGSWVAPGPPDLYGSVPARIVTPSTEFVERDDAYFLDQGTRRLRDMRFQFVPAMHVYEYRGQYSADYATAANLHANDRYNTLEAAWTALSDGSVAILAFYPDRDDLDLLIDTASYEFARLRDPGQMQDMGEMLRMVRAAGELYEVSLAFARVGTDYTWRF